ncbi:hypothetical protein [Alloyangia pacifica]|uniref:hypothetical protein n=1 Tax=Alloyangia pacifica TaxID=311180 RepID=UPI001CD65C8A|nr:hypothetical protein [Alloyangia pacifica]MCA0994077.1 hypothetical protein [Alloyangia pacifica]
MIFAGLFLVAIILLLVFNYRHGETRKCRWRERRSEADSQWICVQCGATTRGPQGQTPERCFRTENQSTPGSQP